MPIIKVADLTDEQRQHVLPGKAVFVDADGDYCITLDEYPKVIGIALTSGRKDERVQIKLTPAASNDRRER